MGDLGNLGDSGQDYPRSSDQEGGSVFHWGRRNRPQARTAPLLRGGAPVSIAPGFTPAISPVHLN
jgi:hypothetical protein